MLQTKANMAGEAERTQLIGELASLLKERDIPDDARSAGMVLIGWLARRMPGEAASRDGLPEMIDRARRAVLNGDCGARIKARLNGRGINGHAPRAGNGGAGNGAAANGRAANGRAASGFAPHPVRSETSGRSEASGSHGLSAKPPSRERNGTDEDRFRSR